MILLATNTTIILLSIAVFLFIILALVLVLLYAKRKLIPQGEVTLKVNEKEYTVEPGQTILSALSDQGIYLPSACGGQGTCGLCTCQILEGGGSILPTEKGFFTRKEEMENWRLGCQVKIRDDMTIKVPPEVMEIKKYECEVVSNKNVATFIKEFVLKLPEGETMNFDPGGYIQLDVPKIEVDFSKDIEVEEEFKDEWDRFGLWDLYMKNNEETFRAYSMANHPAEGNIVKLNVRIATPPWDRSKGKFMNVNPGICSSYVFSRKPGDKVTLSGPFGDFFIKHTDKEMVYIGGGAGMAPLRSHIFHLFKTLKTDRTVSYWYGARSKREIFYEEDFRELEQQFPNFSFHIALSEPKEEDKWDGPVGFIHQVLYDQYLSKLEEPEEIEYYLCGPPVMNDAVHNMLYNLGVPQEMIAFDDFGG
ncbi:MAG: NADH:ubiquinone reductase (Na(+)-transporting) subunit F [Bacteroidales bacterium]